MLKSIGEQSIGETVPGRRKEGYGKDYYYYYFINFISQHKHQTGCNTTEYNVILCCTWSKTNMSRPSIYRSMVDTVMDESDESMEPKTDRVSRNKAIQYGRNWRD